MKQCIETYAYRRDVGVPVFDDAHPIVIFDGDCVMCSAFVRFVLRRDRAGRMRFLAAQTLLGQALYGHFGLKRETFETYVLLEDGRARVKSDAALRIFALLGWPWAMLGGARLVPTFVCDAIYDFVARNRFAWFGAREACYAPTPEEAGRFIR